MNEIEEMFERIREYHSKPNRQKRTDRTKPDLRKCVILRSQQKKYKSNG